jgi:hypothetical protein
MSWVSRAMGPQLSPSGRGRQAGFEVAGDSAGDGGQSCEIKTLLAATIEQ